MSIAADIVQRVDFGSVKDAVSAAWTLAKEWTRWIGHKVIVLSGHVWDMSKMVLIKIVQAMQIVWRGCLPYLRQIVSFLASRPGLFGMGVLASIVLLRMALNDDNLTSRTGRYAVGMIALGLGYFFGAYGAQAGIIPHLLANRA